MIFHKHVVLILSMSQSFRHYIAVRNNWDDEALARFKTFAEAHAKFAVVGKEGQADGKTPHLQVSVLKQAFEKA